MSIQNIHSTHQPEQPARRVADDAPQVVAKTSIAKSPPDIKDGDDPSSEQLRNAADSIKQAMQESNPSLEIEFSVDTDTKKTVVRVMDTHTGELIRQVPSQEVLAIARSIDKIQHGLLLSQKV